MQTKMSYNWYCESCLEGFPSDSTKSDVERHSRERHNGEEVSVGMVIVCPQCNSVMRKTSDGNLMSFICPKDLRIRLVEKAEATIK